MAALGGAGGKPGHALPCWGSTLPSAHTLAGAWKPLLRHPGACTGWGHLGSLGPVYHVLPQTLNVLECSQYGSRLLLADSISFPGWGSRETPLFIYLGQIKPVRLTTLGGMTDSRGQGSGAATQETQAPCRRQCPVFVRRLGIDGYSQRDTRITAGRTGLRTSRPPALCRGRAWRTPARRGLRSRECLRAAV